MRGNQQIFGLLAKKYLSNNRWKDQYPGPKSYADELESFLEMLEAEGQLDRYLPRLNAKQQQRDEVLAELRVAHFFKRSGYNVVEWEPMGNNGKRGEFSLARTGEPILFVEVKSPGWEGQLSAYQRNSGRAAQPKYILGKVEGGAVSPNDAIHGSIVKAYEKFSDNCPNLLVIADDLRFPLQLGGELFHEIALYDTSGGYGALGYFTSSKYERLGGLAILGHADLPTYYFRAYDNLHVLKACKLPQAVLNLKAGV